MKSENRWVYIAGVAILAVLVVVGLIWQGGAGDTSPADGGPDGAASSESDGAAGDGAVEGGAQAATDGGGEGGPRVGDRPVVDDIGAVPEDPAECRAYCGRLAERGVLANGMTGESCITQLCGGEASDAGAAEAGAAEQTQAATDPEVPEMPEDCRAQCQLLDRRGELAEGTTLEACYDALCASDDEEGDGGEE